MSEDRSRDPEGGRAPSDMSDMFSERPGGASGRVDADGQGAETSGKADKLPTPPPPLDEEAVAKHRAAKQARVKKRRDEIRRQQAAAQGRAAPPDTATPAGDGQRAPQGGGKRGSALPALRPDIKPDTPALRAERVEAIRRDLVRRRRRKGGGMLFKLAAFVIFPTLAVAWFLWFQASDMYKSESSFQVRGAESGGGGGAGGLLGAFLGGGGGGGNSLFDPVAVQTYITSRDLLTRLDADHAWIAHFQDPDLDIWHRLPTDATFEQSFSHFQTMVSVSYDPTEGILEMELVAADTESARRFSEAVIGYAEEMVDSLSDRIRVDALRNAKDYQDEKEAELIAAQQDLARVQEQNKLFSIEGEVSQKYALIGALETELAGLEGRLTNLRRVAGESDPRIQRLRAQVATKRAQIKELRDSIAGGGSDQETLAELNSKLISARLNVETATLKFTSAIEQLEHAQSNAARQHRYLQVVSQPSLPDEANYPKKPEMTALAFLAFLGFYIIASLTLSLIREQASI